MESDEESVARDCTAFLQQNTSTPTESDTTDEEGTEPLPDAKEGTEPRRSYGGADRPAAEPRARPAEPRARPPEPRARPAERPASPAPRAPKRRRFEAPPANAVVIEIGDSSDDDAPPPNRPHVIDLT